MTIYTCDNALEALLRIGLQHTKKLKVASFMVIIRNTPGQRTLKMHLLHRQSMFLSPWMQ